MVCSFTRTTRWMTDEIYKNANIGSHWTHHLYGRPMRSDVDYKNPLYHNKSGHHRTYLSANGMAAGCELDGDEISSVLPSLYKASNRGLSVEIIYSNGKYVAATGSGKKCIQAM